MCIQIVAPQYISGYILIFAAPIWPLSEYDVALGLSFCISNM